MEYIEIKNSLDSWLQIFSIYSVEILYILEVIVKKRFSKIKKKRKNWQSIQLISFTFIKLPAYLLRLQFQLTVVRFNLLTTVYLKQITIEINFV